jgi:DNA helicase TIP49 (TBP-interacting protein)
MEIKNSGFLALEAEKQEENSGFWKSFKSNNSGAGNNQPESGGIFGRLTGFTKKSVHLVEELDKELVESQSQYEIMDFKVKGNASVVGGVSLDIHFVKTPAARALSDIKARMLVVIHPDTKQKINIPKTALVGQKKARVKDPNTGDILLIESETGKVLGIKRSLKKDNSKTT